MKTPSNGDGMRRMKFLFDAAQLVKGGDCGDVLNSHYNNTLKEVGLKLVVKMDSNVKKSFCPICKSSYDFGDFSIRRRNMNNNNNNEPKGISRLCKKCGHDHMTLLKRRKNR